ncbi:hypothetical protein GGR57DRAFT_487392 [Xylariaceae sp. FL1272]|nr:hypothetical protein GGR57DRAFT_487392 [Xylariaceae sp. FL1272]
MDIDEDESLRTLAAGGAIDHSAWPALLSHIVARIEKIAHDEFPIPNLPPPVPIVPSSIPPPPDSELSDNFLAPLPSSPTEPASSSSQDTNKENTPVATRNVNLPPSVTAPAPAPAAPVTLPPGTLPAQITHMLSEITSTLTSTFPTYPPHTIQRLSELVVTPKQHYRSLATYLHALDRVVHVTSGLNVYPLPSIHAENPPATMANGIASQSAWASPGSDEALGGALLTPIPWLAPNQQVATGSTTPPTQAAAQESSSDLEGQVRTESTETIEGPNGVGSVETVSVSVNGIPSMGARGVGVTQGELLRQEQRAGVVPISQLVPSHHVHPGQHNASAAAQQQQQQQVRIQHQLALAQAQTQEQVQSSSSPDSPDSVSVPSNAASTPSSATLEEEAAPSEDAEAAAPPITSVHSNNADNEEKPHARGPEVIGADDLGPQSQTTSSLTATTTGPGGVTMQGIDLQAAVGRKPLDSGKTDEDDKEDKMAVDKEENPATPKRDAEDQLEGAVAKKAKEDNAGDIEEKESKEEGDPMDKD